MRREGFLAEADALANHERTDESGDCRVDVHDRAARKVEGAPLPQQARLRAHGGAISTDVRVRAHPEPHHVGNRCVAEGEPQGHEQQHRREFYAFGKRSDDETAGDCRERHLEANERKLWNVDPAAEGCANTERTRDVIPDTLQKQSVEATEKGVAFSERNAVTVNRPENDDERERYEHLHQHRQHVLAADQAAVEQRETRDGHHNDQERGDEHPRRVALVDGRCRRGRSFCGRRSLRGSRRRFSGCRLRCLRGGGFCRRCLRHCEL